MTFAPTNLRSLEREIARGLLEIVPSIDPHHRWTETPEDRPGGGSQRGRLFYLEWGESRQVVGGATGNRDYEWQADLTIIVHYGALKVALLGEAIIQDHADVNRYFIDRLESIPGLTNWEADGHPPRDEDSLVYEQRFLVSYMRR